MHDGERHVGAKGAAAGFAFFNTTMSLVVRSGPIDYAGIGIGPSPRIERATAPRNTRVRSGADNRSCLLSQPPLVDDAAMAQPYVFISYSRLDRQFVDHL
jgi:hypothetical protein